MAGPLTAEQDRLLRAARREVNGYRKSRQRVGAPYPQGLRSALVAVLESGVLVATVARETGLTENRIRVVASEHGLHVKAGKCRRANHDGADVLSRVGITLFPDK